MNVPNAPAVRLPTLFEFFLLVIAICSMTLTFSSVAQAQDDAEIVVQNRADHSTVTAPAWQRFDFTTPFEGEQIVSVVWDGDADIRFSIFRGSQRIDSAGRSSSPSQLSLVLDPAEIYSIAVWASSGAADFTASLEEVNDLGTNPDPLAITAGPTDQTVTEGESAIFSVQTSGGVGELSYQWSEIVNGNVELISGEQQSTLTLASVDAADDGNQYSVTVLDQSATTVTSEPATLTVEALPGITINTPPANTTVAVGDTALFEVIATTGSGTLTYQWFEDGNELDGETESSLQIVSAQLGDSGKQYSVRVSNGVDSQTSQPATLTVNAQDDEVGPYSLSADLTTRTLNGPAPTLDYNATNDSDGWGRTLLRYGDTLLVGGDFTGIRNQGGGNIIDRPWLAALDAVSGQPLIGFNVPIAINSVVRSLALSSNGNQVYVGGDFGIVLIDATTGALDSSFNVTLDHQGDDEGRVFDIVLTSDHLYIGGDFRGTNNIRTRHIAKLSHDGVLDRSLGTDVQGVRLFGREAPVQSLAVSPDEQIIYIGGSFTAINGVTTERTARNNRISLMPVNALDGTVRPERFVVDVGDNAKGVTAHDIVVTDEHVVVAWGGPNFLTVHDHDGTLRTRIAAKGDVQALEIIGDTLFVGHHGEYLGSGANPIPSDAVISLSPRQLVPHRMHTFRLDPDDGSLEFLQAWEIGGFFGIWAIAAAEDGLWLAGEINSAEGSGFNRIEGLVRFPAQ